MATSNPALNERTFARERVVAVDPSALDGGRRVATMTLDGVVQKTALLLFLVVAAGAVGWRGVTRTPDTINVPAWLPIAAIAAFGVALLTIFRPRSARITAPLYAILEGSVVGAISAVYEARFNGIVLQAVLLTIGIAVALLAAFATGRIRVTEKFRMVVISATFAVLVLYLVDLVAHLLGSQIPFMHSGGPMGILFCGAVCVVAALNLLLDFDFIQRGIAAGTARSMEWYAGFAVVLHLVWLYLELLRLLSRLRSR
jgi:uncharacterized YccA/Bax inhibitor family protein